MTSTKRKTPAQRAKLAKLLTGNVPIVEALREAGWADKQAAKGWAAVPESVMALLPKSAKTFIDLGAIDKDIRRNLIRGRLITNLLEGKDGGAMSAKILGSESELNMFTPDTQVGVIVLNAPSSLSERKQELLDA